jgi:RPA family protein
MPEETIQKPIETTKTPTSAPSPVQPQQPTQPTTNTGPRKREIAYKLRIGDILAGNPIIEQQEGRERFRFLELNDKKIMRTNLVANIIEKYAPEGEKRWASITIDDASGQIKVKVFGDDTAKFNELNQGDTILLIGVIRSFNNELYILPEIIKKIDPRYLLVRKLEMDSSSPKPITPEQKQEQAGVKEQIIQLIKSGEAEGGIDIEQIILKLKDASPDQINQEITKLLENGVVYEPRPGRVRYLG